MIAQRACVAYPGLVLAVDDSSARLRDEHDDRRAATVFDSDSAPCDLVIVAAGTNLERLDQASTTARPA